MAKNLIIYYSRQGENYVNGSIVDLKKGNTEICAEFIQKAVGGDLFEIEAVNEYSKDYHKCTEEASRELKENARPELKKYLENIADYVLRFYSRKILKIPFTLIRWQNVVTRNVSWHNP